MAEQGNPYAPVDIKDDDEKDKQGILGNNGDDMDEPGREGAKEAEIHKETANLRRIAFIALILCSQCAFEMYCTALYNVILPWYFMQLASLGFIAILSAYCIVCYIILKQIPLRSLVAYLHILPPLLYIASLLVKTTSYDEFCLNNSCLTDWKISTIIILLPIYQCILLFYGKLTNKYKLFIFSFIFAISTTTHFVLFLAQHNFDFKSILSNPVCYWRTWNRLFKKFEFGGIDCLIFVFIGDILLLFVSLVLMSVHIIFYRFNWDSGLGFKFVMTILLYIGAVQQFLYSLFFEDANYPGKCVLHIYSFQINFLLLAFMFSIEIFSNKPKEKYYTNKQQKVIHIKRGKSVLKLDKIGHMAFSTSNVFVSKGSGGNDRKLVINPNRNIDVVIKVFYDFAPTSRHFDKYFSEIKIQKGFRQEGSVSVIIPFYNEEDYQIFATLKSIHENFEYLKQKDKEYKHKYLNVLLVGDGWSKASYSAKKYLKKLYINGRYPKITKIKKDTHKHITFILQSKHNKPICINPYAIENEYKQKLYMNVTTIMKIDNRKKANSHQWFMGRKGFGEYTQSEYMFFTDAYASLNKEGLYKMIKHMKEHPNVNCATGRARVYKIEQEHEFKKQLRERRVSVVEGDSSDDDVDITTDNDEEVNADIVNNDNIVDDEKKDEDVIIIKDKYHDRWWNGHFFEEPNKVLTPQEQPRDYNLRFDTEEDYGCSTRSHLRACQIFEFEALYGTIGAYLLGGFLPVIPGPCGLYRSKDVLNNNVRDMYFDAVNEKKDSGYALTLGNMQLAEDRILTISSIFNADRDVKHALIKDCIFYFDPITDLNQLMKQRRRWLNGSIATCKFVLQKAAFGEWKTSVFRRMYVKGIFYIQAAQYITTAISPPILILIAYRYSLQTMLSLAIPINVTFAPTAAPTSAPTSFTGTPSPTASIRRLQEDERELIDPKRNRLIMGLTVFAQIVAWTIYLSFIFSSITKKYVGIIRKITLVFSWTIGLLILGATAVQMYDVATGNIFEEEDPQGSQYGRFFIEFTIYLGILFFVQPFVLPLLYTRDWRTEWNLVKTFASYFIYSIFYFTFFFVYAISNIHDLSWGTRPSGANDPHAKNTNKLLPNTIKIAIFFLLVNIIIFFIPFSSSPIFLLIFIIPAFLQIFFSLIYLAIDYSILFWRCIKPKKMQDIIIFKQTSTAQRSDPIHAKNGRKPSLLDPAVVPLKGEPMNNILHIPSKVSSPKQYKKRGLSDVAEDPNDTDNDNEIIHDNKINNDDDIKSDINVDDINDDDIINDDTNNDDNNKQFEE